MKNWLFAGAVAAALCISTAVSGATPDAPATIVHSVERVVDGDTVVVVVKAGGGRTTIRLASIDAPELKMSYGNASRHALERLLADQDVQVRLQKKDRYGRWVGALIVNGEDINLKMVALGWAWHYTQYAKEQPSEEASLYAEAQKSAEQAHLGLWHGAAPIPPWDWRQRCRHGSPQGRPDFCWKPPSIPVKATDTP
ncbi:MAG: thermonuclease family protein [Hylemonella sp.]|nr:thermonuclease family protein [Hylemonella sp.]